MMTTEQKMMMYKEKKAFIKNISKAFEVGPRGCTVTSIDYEVYRHASMTGYVYEEYIIVNFDGGAKCVRVANGNGNMANFREIGKLIDGGYYDEINMYENLTKFGFELVNLEEVQ